MVCLACARSGSPLCWGCSESLSRVPPRVISDGVTAVEVHSVFAHRSAASKLVRNLKYRRSAKVAMFLAVHMAELLPPRTAALVPVPRVLARRAMYGIDQTRLLAEAVGHLTGVPVIHALRAPVWEPRSAGKRRSDRSVATFTAVRSVPTGLVLVDDVCTTGRTVIGAARTLGLSSVPVVVATSAGTMGVRIDDSPTKEVA